MFIDDDAALALIPAKHLTACVGLWALAESWSRRKGMGGFIPVGLVERLGGTAREASLLVSSGLWAEADNGYQMVPREQQATVTSEPLSAAERSRRYRQRHGVRDGTRHGGVTERDGQRDGQRDASVAGGVSSVTLGGKGGSELSDPDLSSPSVSPSPPGSENTQLAGCNERARGEKPNALRFRFELEELVRAAFVARNVTPPKAAASQWCDACQTVQDALDMGLYADARAAMEAFAPLIVDACAAMGGNKLGLALQQTTLGAQLRPVAGGRQLSELAQRALAAQRGGA